jgi:hypothetical protein
MKKLILALWLGCWALGVAAQVETLKIAKVKKGEEPKAVMDAIKNDFPKFIAKDLSFLPPKLYGEEWNISTEGNADNSSINFYQITLKEEKGDYYTAIYDKNGKLLSSKQEIDNSKLPKEVSETISKFIATGWHVDRTHDIIKYTGGNKISDTYKVKLEKGIEHKILFLDLKGNIINTRFAFF